MSTETNKQVSYDEALQEILISVVDAKDFILSQAPDVVHQLLTWKMIESMIHFGLQMGAMFSLFFVAVKYSGRGELLPEDKRRYGHMYKATLSHNKEGDIEVGAIFIGGLFIVIEFLLILNLSFDWLKILLAPKLYLIEYAALLVK